jgi:polysaccharide export outer membrane protein
MRRRATTRTAYLLGFVLVVLGASPLAMAAQDVGARDGLVLPGDRIGIRTWTAEEMDGQYDVDELGDVILPRLGRVTVGGLTSSQVRHHLQTSYDEFLRGTTVEVRVLRRVGVGGEVNLPSLYWIDSTISLRDAIAMAGGVSPLGNPKRVLLLRSTERIAVDLESEVSNEPTALLSGDQILVPLKSWLSRNTPLVVSTGASMMAVLAGILLAR